MPSQSKEARPMFDRSDKASHPLPRLVFSALRALDPYFQHLLIFEGIGSQILSAAALPVVPAGPKGTVLVAMAAACALKQIINIAYILETKIHYSAAVGIGIYNTLTNSIASLSSIYYGPSTELGPMQYAGISLFTVGLFTELICELQRKRFKDDPANQGKVYTGGLFSLARHINYGGYTLWRTGLALTSGNYWWAGLQLGFHLWYFTTMGVPDVAGYCSKRYGEQWTQYERKVPNILLPYIW